jgi:hypothetical protein
MEWLKEGCCLAHLHVLASAYRCVESDGGLGPEPPAVQEVVKAVMEAADPRIPDVLEWVREVVELTPQVSRGWSYVTEKDLVSRFWRDNGFRITHDKTGTKPEYKMVLRRAMEMLGRHCDRRLRPIDPETGKQIDKVGYKWVRMRAETE